MCSQTSLSALPSTSAFGDDCAAGRPSATHVKATATARGSRILLQAKLQPHGAAPEVLRISGGEAVERTLLANEIRLHLDELIQIPVHAGGPHGIGPRRNPAGARRDKWRRHPAVARRAQLLDASGQLHGADAVAQEGPLGLDRILLALTGRQP